MTFIVKYVGECCIIGSIMSIDDAIFSVRHFQTFGDLLKYLRRRAHLTQRELSIAVNYSESHISRLERNLRQPDMAALIALFIPALSLEGEPDTVSYMLELAAQARGEILAQNPVMTFTQTVEKETPDDTYISAEQIKNNLPLQLTSFIGRQQEIAETTDLIISNKARLITLTGPGGTGKTRLALQTAKKLEHRFPDGVVLVELASISKTSPVENKFLSSLGLPKSQSKPPGEVLTDFLKAKKILLIVDNCEHVMPGTAQLLFSILQACPNVQILATSREVLNIPGEVRYIVPPLSTSKSINSESAALFIDRAKTTLPIFELTENNTSGVIEICQRLEGIPLAIELAAARVSVLSVNQIASLLERNLKLLEGGSVIPARHRTMTATIDWSYQLLSEAESILFRRLSVFSGGWTLDAAMEIACDQLLIPAEKVPGLLSQLVNKSLVTVKWDSKSEPRYDMLQTLLEYARRKLFESGEYQTLRDRHFQYFYAIAQQRERELFYGKRTIDWAETEIDNLREVLSWALNTNFDSASSVEHTGKAMELMSHVHLLWMARGFFSEGKEWLDKLLAAHPDATLYRARALVLACVFARIDGDIAKELALARQSLSISKKLGARKHLAWSLCWLGWAEGHQGNQTKSIQYLTESLELLEALEEDIWVTYATFFLAQSYMSIGDLDAARSLWKQGIAFCEKKDFKWQVGWGLQGLGDIEKLEGNYIQARKYYSDSMRIREKLSDVGGIASCLESLAELEGLLKQTERAAKLWGAAERLRTGLNQFGISVTKSNYIVSDVHSRLGTESFHLSWKEGQGMSIEKAIEFALGTASIS